MEKTHIIIILGALSLVASASAIAGHAYVSGLAGYGGAGEGLAFEGTDKMIDTKQTKFTNANWLATGKIKKGGLVERLAAGYQFSNSWFFGKMVYFGLELGATHYANTTIDLTGAGPNNFSVIYPEDGTSNWYSGKYTATGSIKLSTWVVDALAKVTIPLGSKMYAFGKAGVAYVNAKESGSVTTTQSSQLIPNGGQYVKVNNDPHTINQKIHAILPEAAVGLGYKITPNVSAELTGDYVFGSNLYWNARTSVPDLYYVGVGLNYNF